MWHLGKMRHLDWFQIEMMQVPKSRANLKSRELEVQKLIRKEWMSPDIENPLVIWHFYCINSWKKRSYWVPSSCPIDLFIPFNLYVRLCNMVWIKPISSLTFQYYIDRCLQRGGGGEFEVYIVELSQCPSSYMFYTLLVHLWWIYFFFILILPIFDGFTTKKFCVQWNSNCTTDFTK